MRLLALTVLLLSTAPALAQDADALLAVHREIVARTRGTGGLVVVDEAQDFNAGH